MKKVLVLMSVYNGAKYIEEQLDSIFSQEDVSVNCLIRDDGSTDHTKEIVKSYCTKNKKISFLAGENIGWAMSFYNLVENTRYTNYDYYAFSDQDDLWDYNKLIVAINKMEKVNTTKPLLYCSNLKVVDKDLNWSQGKYMFDKVNLSKNHALVENFSTGCTQVFNNEMKNLYLDYKPNYLHAHDYWLYLIATFVGVVIYDNNAYINYRQHDYNVKGAGKGPWKLWKNRIRSLSKVYLKDKFKEHSLEKMAQELLKGYRSKMTVNDIEMIQVIAFYRHNIWKKILFFFCFKIKKTSINANIGLRLRILLGII